MNVVFQLTKRPDLTEAQRLSEALDRERGVVSALVDPQLARIFVTFDPDLTGDMALQRVVERMGHHVTDEAEPLGFTTETPGYVAEAENERMGLDRAVGMLQDAEFTLPDREPRGG
ncbi:hypothetical protein D3C72_1632640 [compost metagenome]